MGKKRLDVLLCERGLAESRQKAQATIMSGCVFVDGQRQDKPGTAVPADAAVEVNSNVENIGARRLQTVIERVLDDLSFSAPDRSGETVVVDADYVRSRVADLAKNADLSRFIL